MNEPFAASVVFVTLVNVSATVVQAMNPITRASMPDVVNLWFHISSYQLMVKNSQGKMSKNVYKINT